MYTLPENHCQDCSTKAQVVERSLEQYAKSHATAQDSRSLATGTMGVLHKPDGFSWFCVFDAHLTATQVCDVYSHTGRCSSPLGNAMGITEEVFVPIFECTSVCLSVLYGYLYARRFRHSLTKQVPCKV